MSDPTVKIVQIAQTQQQPRLSAVQTKFNGLIAKIDAQKKLLAAWQEVTSQCQQEAAEKLNPLRQTFSEQQAAMVALLDHLFLTQKFTRNQQDKIRDLVTSMCKELIGGEGRDDLKAIYNRYSEVDFDAEAEEDAAIQGEFMKSLFEQKFGVELDGDEYDWADPEGTASRLADKLQERQRQAEEQRRPRKKTAKQLAKEAREQEEQANVSKSIQAVYRQLVAALHPDREQDPIERERKTALMQKVTVAYGNRDLLQLLELQLSVEQIDQSKINIIADDRLKHYNKILQNQLDELREEVIHLEMNIKGTMGISPYEPLTPKRLRALLKEDVRALQHEIARITQDLRRFKDVKQFKAWLKGYQVPLAEFDPILEWYER